LLDSQAFCQRGNASRSLVRSQCIESSFWKYAFSIRPKMYKVELRSKEEEYRETG
jgi:hypothetical protein